MRTLKNTLIPQPKKGRGRPRKSLSTTNSPASKVSKPSADTSSKTPAKGSRGLKGLLSLRKNHNDRDEDDKIESNKDELDASMEDTGSKEVKKGDLELEVAQEGETSNVKSSKKRTRDSILDLHSDSEDENQDQNGEEEHDDENEKMEYVDVKEATADTPTSTGKRGRGRPPQKKAKTSVSEVSLAQTYDSAQKSRGRGRPRKSDASVNSPLKPKSIRGRGRPRKSGASIGSLAPASTSKGRGRPRKSIDSEDMVDAGALKTDGEQEGLDEDEALGSSKRAATRQNFPYEISSQEGDADQGNGAIASDLSDDTNEIPFISPATQAAIDRHLKEQRQETGSDKDGRESRASEAATFILSEYRERYRSRVGHVIEEETVQKKEVTKGKRGRPRKSAASDPYYEEESSMLFENTPGSTKESFEIFEDSPENNAPRKRGRPPKKAAAAPVGTKEKIIRAATGASARNASKSSVPNSAYEADESSLTTSSERNALAEIIPATPDIASTIPKSGEVSDDNNVFSETPVKALTGQLARKDENARIAASALAAMPPSNPPSRIASPGWTAVNQPAPAPRTNFFSNDNQSARGSGLVGSHLDRSVTPNLPQIEREKSVATPSKDMSEILQAKITSGGRSDYQSPLDGRAQQFQPVDGVVNSFYSKLKNGMGI